MKTVTITEFRRNLFQLVDEALVTGEPIQIRRKGGCVVVRGEGGEQAETRRRAERWRRFWASPPFLRLGGDLGPEDIRLDHETHGRWEGEDELDF